ncbi:hypothetical protein GCM10020367_11960 [Streptomyces sannanensis]|uniref:Sensor domain-containing protein n=1 Tax=Streptomyces sannanensis TaxID=285536 RepID=A0ABP6S6T5_9ACTN
MTTDAPSPADSPSPAAPSAPPDADGDTPGRPAGTERPAYSAETTTRLRLISVPAPAGTPRPAGPPAHPAHPVPPEAPAETTVRLRPVAGRRPGRTVAAAVCAVLGTGLIGGAAAGSWLTRDTDERTAAERSYDEARSLWHSTPVDTLFPRTLHGTDAGPGGADRNWTRVAVAPDSGCSDALDPLLDTALAPVGCRRLVRATYADATGSSVTTVGMVFTEADTAAMKALRTRFTAERLAERTDLLPRTYPVEGTAAAGFGPHQRASWTVRVLTDVPVVVYAVSGFADGRTVRDPQPVDKAMAEGATTAVAQAGLGHEAKGIADRVERALRKTVTTVTEKPG